MKYESIIKGKVDKFKHERGYDTLSDTKVFELFTNYQIIYSEQPDIFFGNSDILDVITTSGSNDMGIDGLAIKINDSIISSFEDFECIIAKKRKIKIGFIFIQAKYGSRTQIGEFNTFMDGIKDFLKNDEPVQPYNDKIKHFVDLKNQIFNDKYLYLWEENPTVEAYFITMGEHKELPHIEAAIKKFNQDIQASKGYSDSIVHILDSGKLKSLCESNENSYDVTFKFIENMGLNEVDNVEDSCVLLCKGDEFVKLLLNENDTLRRTIFNDNVRDYQGDTHINVEIKKTIEKEPDKFVLLNNGITIVCDKFINRNRSITISNPQIVNGCQTSSVLYNAYKNKYDIGNVPILVKIISTINSHVTTQIVRGTNRQNIVYDEAFEITRPFHKDLEAFFASQTVEGKQFFYERRARQFTNNMGVKQDQKASFKNIIQSVVSMFFYKPDLAHLHESKLLKEFQNRIFLQSHSLYPYFAAPVTLLHLEKYFKENPGKKYCRIYKFHILMIMNLLVCPSQLDITNSKLIDQHCDKLLTEVVGGYRSLAGRAINIFERCSADWISEDSRNKYAIKDNYGFVTSVLKYFDSGASDKEIYKQPVYTGNVVKVSIDRKGNYYGFIDHQPYDLFFHENTNRHLDFTKLVGTMVSYEIGKNYRDEDIAINIRRLA